jgi:hypothetical protein
VCVCVCVCVCVYVCVCVCVLALEALVCEMLRVNTRVNKIDLQGCNVTDKGFENLVPAHWPHTPLPLSFNTRVQ